MIKKSNNGQKKWFCHQTYLVASATKMEQELAKFTRQYAYGLFTDAALRELGRLVNDEQERIYEDNKRLRKVHIELTMNPTFGCYAALHVGGGHSLSFRAVEGEYE